MQAVCSDANPLNLLIRFHGPISILKYSMILRAFFDWVDRMWYGSKLRYLYWAI